MSLLSRLQPLLLVSWYADAEPGPLPAAIGCLCHWRSPRRGLVSLTRLDAQEHLVSTMLGMVRSRSLNMIT